MGELINSKILTNNNIIYKILLEKEETLALKNAIKNINIFSADLCNIEAGMIKRGKNGVTMHFEIPFKLRFRKKKTHNKISYQKLETPTKIFYIYVIKKEIL
jgi:hypothetical protein